MAKRYTLLPIPENEKELFEYYQRHVSTFWTVNEVIFDADKEEFVNLDVNVQNWLKTTLAFFASADVLINQNIFENFLSEVENTTAQAFYSIQAAMETIHSQMYSLLIDELIDDEEKPNLFNAIETIPVVKAKADFVFKYMDAVHYSFVQRLFVFALIEGVGFASSFASIFFLKHTYPGQVKSLTFSNELISKDETLHFQFGGAYYRFLKNTSTVTPLEQSFVTNVIHDFLKIEKEFIYKAVPVDQIGIDPSDMMYYIKWCCNIVLQNFEMHELFKIQECPLEYMQKIDLNSQANFFENKESSYGKTMSTNEALCFDNDTDF